MVLLSLWCPIPFFFIFSNLLSLNFWLKNIGRHRWVEYASKTRYNASQVPPEWHGWLHYITDRTGDEVNHYFSFIRSIFFWQRYGMANSDPLQCSFWCWNQRGMGLNTKKTCLERVINTSTIPRVTHSTLGKGIGPDMNPGNPPSLNLSATELAPILSISFFFEVLELLSL